MVASRQAIFRLALMSCVIRGFVARNNLGDHCLVKEPSCSAAQGASMLQGSISKGKTLLKRENEKAQGTSNTKYIAGVRVYNYHRAVENDSQTTWILMLRQNSSDDQLHSLCKEFGSNCSLEGHRTGFGVPFVAAVATPPDLERILSAHSDVDFVESDSLVSAIPEIPSGDEPIHVVPNEIQTGSVNPSKPLSWGLDRIDDAEGLDESYDGSSDDGHGVHVYVLDSGINENHIDFQGRAIPYLDMTIAEGEPTFCSNSGPNCCADDGGHGTHCAGTVAGLYSGVARGAQVYSVKVVKYMDLCNSNLEPCGRSSWAVGGIDQVVASGPRPAVISMSLAARGVNPAYTRAIDSAVVAGVTVVVAAGNENTDACKFAPAHVGNAITVGSTDLTSNGKDWRSYFSNFGTCVDIFAPGSNILSANSSSNDLFDSSSGTSMACPHVAGAAAILLGRQPTLSPAEVKVALVQNAGSGLILDSKAGSPNKLLRVTLSSKQGPDAGNQFVWGPASSVF